MGDYSTGEANVKLQLHSEKNVTIEFVVGEANQMWREMRQTKIKFGDEQGSEWLMREMHKQHPEFCKAYPMVNRYICQMQEYDSKIFKLWLMKIKENPWKTEEGYLDAQADYVAMLFRAKKPRSSLTEINNVRKNIKAMLQKEHNAFKHYAKEFELEVNAEESSYQKKNVVELREFVELVGVDGIAEAGVVRMETDLELGSLGVNIDELCGLSSVISEKTLADDLLS